MKDKLFVVRKYVYAKDAKDAMRKEKKQNADDVWLDDEWKKENITENKKIGF